MTAQSKIVLCAGGAELAVHFVARPFEPAQDFAELKWRGRELVAALGAEILDPFLARWTRAPGDRRAELTASVEAAMNECIAAFRDCAPERARKEERAVMAALAVTANLQRTLLYLGETLARPRRRGEARTKVLLAREWCGLVPRPKRGAAPGPVQFKLLVRALGCTPAEIDARCREALAVLRTDLDAGRMI